MSDLTPKMTAALQQAAGFGLYHEFSNTSTVNALVRRGLIQSGGGVGWYRATASGERVLKTPEPGHE